MSVTWLANDNQTSTQTNRHGSSTRGSLKGSPLGFPTRPRSSRSYKSRAARCAFASRASCVGNPRQASNKPEHTIRQPPPKTEMQGDRPGRKVPR